MRYMVRQKMFSIGDDFWITDEQGNRVFLVDGKALRIWRRSATSPGGSTTCLDRIHEEERR